MLFRSRQTIGGLSIGTTLDPLTSPQTRNFESSTATKPLQIDVRNCFIYRQTIGGLSIGTTLDPLTSPHTLVLGVLPQTPNFESSIAAKLLQIDVRNSVIYRQSIGGLSIGTTHDPLTSPQILVLGVLPQTLNRQ